MLLGLIKKITSTIIILGAINFGIYGMFHINFIEVLFGQPSLDQGLPFWTRWAYIILGISGCVALLRCLFCSSCHHHHQGCSSSNSCCHNHTHDDQK